MIKTSQLAKHGGDDVRAESSNGAECVDGNSKTHQTAHQLQSEKSLEHASREDLIETIRALRRECQANRKSAREAMEYLEQMRQHIIAAETQIEAIRAGLVDVDAWVFLDTSGITINAEGKLEGSADAIEKLRQAKPFLFKGGKQ